MGILTVQVINCIEYYCYKYLALVNIQLPENSALDVVVKVNEEFYTQPILIVVTDHAFPV